MKARLIVPIFVMLFSNISIATVWRVNNNDNTADFSEIQIAHDNVEAGDTLYIEGSPNFYQSLTLNKKLIIIGPGYFLSENLLSANFYSAKARFFYFEEGSEGSVVIGMTFNYSSTSSANAYTDNISIERCYMNGYVDIKNVSGVRVIGNYLKGIRSFSSTTTFDQVFFNNNIVTGNISINESCNVITSNNNIFTSNNLTYNSYEFRSNIIFNESATVEINGQFTENNIVTNNILSGNNLNVSSLTDLFIGGESPDGQYQLASNSLAIGAGYQGVDCGIFGGGEPYVLSGLPSIPTITELEVDEAASIQSGLNVHIKVKSN